MNIPKGYKLVPFEPTKEMLFACEEAGSITNHLRGARIYRAMLAAAQTPPQPIYAALNFVCTALPGPGNECAFVELENNAGESLGHGEWRNRDDGLVELHISAPPCCPEEASDFAELRAELALAKRYLRQSLAAHNPRSRLSCDIRRLIGMNPIGAKAVEVGHE